MFGCDPRCHRRHTTTSQNDWETIENYLIQVIPCSPTASFPHKVNVDIQTRFPSQGIYLFPFGRWACIVKHGKFLSLCLWSLLVWRSFLCCFVPTQISRLNQTELFVGVWRKTTIHDEKTVDLSRAFPLRHTYMKMEFHEVMKQSFVCMFLFAAMNAMKFTLNMIPALRA